MSLLMLVALLIAIIVYLLPTIVAMGRGVPNTTLVIIINLLLGWSILGWIIAMLMAARPVAKRR